VRIGAGQRVPQRAGRHPPPGQSHSRPAQARPLLRAQHQVQAATERVTVHQQAAAPRGHDCVTHRRGQHRSTGAPASAQDGEYSTRGVGVVQAFAQCGDQKALPVGQLHHMLGAYRDRATPQGVLRCAVGEHKDTIAAGKTRLGTALRRSGVEQNQRRTCPREPRACGVDRQLQLAAGSSGKPQQLLLQWSR